MVRERKEGPTVWRSVCGGVYCCDNVVCISQLDAKETVEV